MALVDWNIFKDNSNIVSGVDFMTPIAGVGSLFINRGINGNSTVNIVPTDAGIHPHGRNDGRLRTLIRWDAQGGSTTTQGVWAGVLCLQSQDDLTQGVGSAYGFGLFTSEGFQTPAFRLYKFNNTGVNGLFPPGTILEAVNLVDVPSLSIGIGIPYAIQIEWITDFAILGGTQLICSVGAALDFSDLTPIISYIDITSPILAGVSEGLVANMKSSTAVFDVQISFDQTSLFELI